MGTLDLGASGHDGSVGGALQRELGARIETGTVFMNRCDYLDPYLVWTGVKETGRGAALSKYGFDALTQPKSFHLRDV